jgi:hypothetical protein
MRTRERRTNRWENLYGDRSGVKNISAEGFIIRGHPTPTPTPTPHSTNQCKYKAHPAELVRVQVAK